MSTKITISKKIAIKDEGVLKTSDVNSINFTGTGITATNVGNDITVNVPASPAGVTSVTATFPINSTGGATPIISIPQASGFNSGYLTQGDHSTFSSKQNQLTSGSSIKSINNASILTSGNLDLQTTLVSGTSIKTVNGVSLLGSGNIFAGGSAVAQTPTIEDQYQAAAGSGSTILFSANVISSLGQTILLDFMVRNNLALTSTFRVYVSSSASIVGATIIGSIVLSPSVDSIRYFHRLVVTRNSSFNYYLSGFDTYVENDFSTGQTYSNAATLGFNAITKPWIIVTLNQSASLVNAIINY